AQGREGGEALAGRNATRAGREGPAGAVEGWGGLLALRLLAGAQLAEALDLVGRQHLLRLLALLGPEILDLAAQRFHLRPVVCLEFVDGLHLVVTKSELLVVLGGGAAQLRRLLVVGLLVVLVGALLGALTEEEAGPDERQQQEQRKEAQAVHGRVSETRVGGQCHFCN